MSSKYLDLSGLSYLWSKIKALFATKVNNATNGNLAGLDANGNITDSGSKSSDFATAEQGTKADGAIQMPSIGTVGQVLKKTAIGVEWANENGYNFAFDIAGNDLIVTYGSTISQQFEISNKDLIVTI